LYLGKAALARLDQWEKRDAAKLTEEDKGDTTTELSDPESYDSD
jgi:hypothetical protein